MTYITTPIDPQSHHLEEIRPPQPYWRRPSTWGGVVVLAILVYIIVGLLRGEPGTGEITFGHALDESHRVSVQEQVFHPGDQFTYSASLTDKSSAADLRIRVTVVDADGKSDTATNAVAGASGEVNLVTPQQPLEITGEMIGSWTIEVLRGEEVLASGSFTVTAD